MRLVQRADWRQSENSLAVASWLLPLDGWVTVIVSAPVNAMTLFAIVRLVKKPAPWLAVPKFPAELAAPGRKVFVLGTRIGRVWVFRAAA